MPGPTELLIILAIVLILFGAGRVSKLGGEMGSAIANFRRGVNDGKEEKNNNHTTNEEVKS